MRKTGPVTQKEIPFPKGAQIISATDLKSRITCCNQDFVRISGYSEEELLGEAHNILRHPDMPQAAFAMLWDRVQSGKPWMGIVKNRAKNGDHYWVDAYVTPMKESGQMVGYESVRFEPDRDMVKRAEEVYQRINNGRQPLPFWPKHKSSVAALIGLLGLTLSNSLIALVATNWLPGITAMVLSATISALVALPIYLSYVNKQTKTAEDVINDPIAQYIYTGDLSAQGKTKMAVKASHQHLHTVLERLEQLSNEVSELADKSSSAATEAAENSQHQEAEVQSVTSATQAMKSTIGEITESTEQASISTTRGTTEATKGAQILTLAIKEIEQLNSTIQEANQEITQLSEDSQEIRSVLEVISSIAEQTNLLALNAAIEAARAGEQGRGFAVVADEVRSLAQRTQESTSSIAGIIEKLTSTTDQAVKTMEQGTKIVVESQEKINDAGEAIRAVETVVNDINARTVDVGSVSEKQLQSAQDIIQTTESIVELSASSSDINDKSQKISEKLAELASAQKLLIQRFRS